MTDELSKSIESAFRLGADYRQASVEAKCEYRDILDWLAIGDNMKRVELLQLEPAWKAKKKVTEDAAVNVDSAWKFVAKKLPAEFGDKQQLAPPVIQVNIYTDEQQKRIAARVLGVEGNGLAEGGLGGV
mgnify:CR=1 FL=1